MTRNNLATAYQAAGQLDEAIPLLESTLADRKRILGPDDPDTLMSWNNLATAYQAAGRLDEAIQLYEQNLVLQQRLVTSGSARVVRFSGGGLAVASPV